MKRLFHGVIHLLTLSLLVFIAFNFSALQQEVGETQYNRLVNDLSKVTTTFATWINTKKEMLNTTKDIVDNLPYEEVIAYATENPYLSINKDDTAVSEVYVGLTNGDFITGGQWVPPDDYDPRSRVWYKEAVEADRTIISQTYFDRETGDQLVTISSPLYMEDRFVGVISADVFLTEINVFLKQQLFDERVYAYLIDDKGMVIVHTKDSSLVGEPLLEVSQEVYNYYLQAQSTSDLISLRYDFRGDRIQGIMQAVAEHEWYLSVAMVDEDRYQDILLMDMRTVIFNAFMLVVMLGLVYIIVKMKQDLDERNESLRLDTEKDFLTGIFNRRYFDHVLEKMWQDAKAESPISLLMIDIDYFKDYNDTYGHLKGDEVLRTLTEIVKGQIRSEDVLARYGGEEFAVILSKMSIETARSIAEKIRVAVEEAHIEHLASPYDLLTISVGVNIGSPESMESLNDFVEGADKALYEAKASGRNQVV